MIIFAVSLLSGCSNLIDGGIESGKDVRERLGYDLPSSSEILQETQERWKDIDFVEMESLLSISLERPIGMIKKITISLDGAVSKTSSTAYVKQKNYFSCLVKVVSFLTEVWEYYQIHSNGRIFSVRGEGGDWSDTNLMTEVQWPGTGYEDLSEEEMDEFEVSKVRTVERKSCYELIGNIEIEQAFSVPGLEEFFQEMQEVPEIGKIPVVLYIDRETYLPVRLVYKLNQAEDEVVENLSLTVFYKGWNRADEIDLPEEVREIFEEAINE